MPVRQKMNVEMNVTYDQHGIQAHKPPSEHFITRSVGYGL